MSASGRYLLGDSQAEIRHLVEQAEVYAKEATELFDLIGVEPGSAMIDLGCGVLGVVHLLAERVGASGRVVGLDRENKMLESGRRFAEQHTLAVDFIEADATATGLPAHSFDVVHARTLLLNVQNPREIIAEMVRIAKPGSVVALQEPDASAWSCDPPHPAFDILRSAILNAYRRTGKDFNIGRRIARMLRNAGVAGVQVRPTARVTHAGDYYQTFLLTIASLVRDVVVHAGDLTADEFDSYAEVIRAHLEARDTITCPAHHVAGLGANRPNGRRGLKVRAATAARPRRSGGRQISTLTRCCFGRPNQHSRRWRIRSILSSALPGVCNSSPVSPALFSCSARESFR